MNSLLAQPSVVNLHADQWDSRNVGQFAAYAMRQPGNIANLVGDLQASSYRPWNRNGERNERSRIWFIENSKTKEVLAEEPSLYKAIHKIAK